MIVDELQFQGFSDPLDANQLIASLQHTVAYTHIAALCFGARHKFFASAAISFSPSLLDQPLSNQHVISAEGKEGLGMCHLGGSC